MAASSVPDNIRHFILTSVPLLPYLEALLLLLLLRLVACSLILIAIVDKNRWPGPRRT